MSRDSDDLVDPDTSLLRPTSVYIISLVESQSGAIRLLVTDKGDSLPFPQILRKQLLIEGDPGMILPGREDVPLNRNRHTHDGKLSR